MPRARSSDARATRAIPAAPSRPSVPNNEEKYNVLKSDQLARSEFLRKFALRLNKVVLALVAELYFGNRAHEPLLQHKGTGDELPAAERGGRCLRPWSRREVLHDRAAAS